jgi:hypothetical protein
VRYVITLDSDTQLPRDAGRELVGCAAHPLNQAEIDPHSGAVVAGTPWKPALLASKGWIVVAFVFGKRQPEVRS